MDDRDLIARRQARLDPSYPGFYERPLQLVRGPGTA